MGVIGRNRRRARTRVLASQALMVAGGAAVASLAAFLDKRRRAMARDRAAATFRRGAERGDRSARYLFGVARGAVHRASGALRPGEREYDDTTLARKVESEIFRPADAPKATVSVSVQHGVVELRGEVGRPEDVAELAAAAARVEGVKDVHNLLHTPESPPRHPPPSDPGEVRARAEESPGSSRFARNPATAPPDDQPSA